jgi:hypothetical protein
MFHTPNERVSIGRRVFAHEITKEEAAREYSVSIQSIVNYVKEYMKSAGIEAIPEADAPLSGGSPNYSEMTKDQLIAEIMRKDIEVARAKKGYAVKGGGRTKEFISIKDSSTK